MLVPAPSPRPAAALDVFGQIVDTAMRNRQAETPDAALASGVDVYGLCRYVAGTLEPWERREMEAQLINHPWAMSRVVALVKGARVAGSPAALLVELANSARLFGSLKFTYESEDALAQMLGALG